MTRHVVSSSRIYAIGYDPEKQLLEVEFMPTMAGRRAIWQYEGVGLQVAEQLYLSASIGREFSIIQENYRGRSIAMIDVDGVEVRFDNENEVIA
jgi:hypothetical protein